MRFFLNMNPPTITAQEKKLTIRNGKPVMYEPPKLRNAREKLTANLYQHRPEEPYEGPIILFVAWCFPHKGNHSEYSWKTTKPDTDNLQKLLKDCMTVCRYWRDDAQVCVEHVEKRWADVPGIMIEVHRLK